MHLRGNLVLREDDWSGKEHRSLLGVFLQLYGRTLTNLVAIISDNFVIYKCLTDSMGTNVIGCASHRYNLSTKDIVNNHWKLIKRVDMILPNLCFPVCHVIHWKATPLAPISCFYKKQERGFHWRHRWSATSKWGSAYRTLKLWVLKISIYLLQMTIR